MTEPLRIAILTATFPPYYAGTGNVAYDQAAGLARRGHDVTVLTATYPGEIANPDGVEVVRLRPAVRLGNAPLLPQLPSRLKDFDVIHLHQPFIFGAETVAATAKLRRIPLVSTIHNALIADGPKGKLFDGYSNIVLPFTLRTSAVIAGLTPSHVYSIRQVARELRHHPEKLRLVPNAVDTDRFSPAAINPAVRERWGIPRQAPLALLCAALDEAHRSKRADLAVAATARVDGLHLLIVGSGPLAAELTRQAEDLGIPDRVHFAGFQRDGLADYYRAADVLVLCSDLESFGLVQVEAMACARPVIITDLPGVRDVSVDGEHGFHIKPDDVDDLTQKLREFFAQPAERRQEMGLAARQHVLDHFTWKHSLDALDGALRAAVVAR